MPTFFLSHLPHLLFGDIMMLYMINNFVDIIAQYLIAIFQLNNLLFTNAAYQLYIRFFKSILICSILGLSFPQFSQFLLMLQ